MSRSTFDTLAAARNIEATGIQADQAEAIVGAIRQAGGDQVTAPELRAELAELRAHVDKGFANQTAALGQLKADIYRAQWIQAAAILGVLTGLLALFD